MSAVSWAMPAATTRADGSPRRVGVEFELQGLTVSALARLTAAALQGTVREVSAVEFSVEVPGLDDYRIEVDYDLLKIWARRQAEADEGAANDVEGMLVDLVTAASSVIVPCEVITPPIPMSDLAEPMGRLVKAVRRGGGKGTRQSPLYAFGLHLNVEPPALDARTVTAYLKAFVCLYDWIVADSELDLSRRITPFIAPFPNEYEDLLLEPKYWPDWDKLIADYLHWNPTRNRALDMLPMFADHDTDITDEVPDSTLVKPRPAFHYRLANCEIDDPEWSIETPWSYWLQIEHLATDTDALTQCCAALAADHRSRLLRRMDVQTWCMTVTRWLRTF